MDVAILTSLCKLVLDGLAIVIIVILYIKTNNKREKEYEQERKKNESINKEIHDSYSQMIQDIVKGVNKHYLTYEESKELVQIDKQINNILNTILKSTEASRVGIVKYHNGNKDMTGKSFLKMSMTNEVVNIGIAPMMSDFKDIFRSLLSYWCHKVEEDKIYYIENPEKIKNIDTTMYQYLKTRNIGAEYGAVLEDYNKNAIGFLYVEYLDGKHFDINRINEAVNANLSQIQTLIAINGEV